MTRTLKQRTGLVLGAVAIAATSAIVATNASSLVSRLPAAPGLVSRASTDATARHTPAPQRFREVTLPAGTRIQLRLGSPYSSESSRVEERVNATLVSNIRANGLTALPAGSRVSGVVSTVERPGKVKGRGAIGLRFNSVTVAGERYPINASYLRVAPATKKRDAAKIGIPAAGGAIVGGILGGKKGALAGAAIGGGAGTAVVLSTRGKDAYIGSGSVINVTLRRALTVRIPL